MEPLNIPQIIDLASAFYGSSLLFTALELDVFTAIKKTANPTLENLVIATQTDKRGLRLLLDGAVAIGLLTKSCGVYALTPATERTLVKDSVNDLTKAIAYNRDVYPAWGKLTQLVRTGKPVESPQKHLGDDAARTRSFALSMHGRAMGIGKAVVPQLGLSDGMKILDLAGGPGTYAMLMAKSFENLTCDTYDLPAISAVAKEITAEVSTRVHCHAGDYHSDVYPEKTYDAVTIFGALHQESPEMIVNILKRAHSALKPNGKIFILDMMTNEDHTSPEFSALFAINMALTTENGWVFSSEEITEYLQAAGFHDISCNRIPPPMPHWLATAFA